MEPYQLPESTGEIRELLAPSVAGFLAIRDRGEIIDPKSLGSGTFVRLKGDVFGILTAAHVLEVIPEETPVGLMCFTRINAVGQYKIIINKSQKLFAPGWKERGYPDLGFLRLYEEVDHLKAKGCVFYDLERSRVVNVTPPGPASYVTGVLGVSRMVMTDAEEGKRTSFIALIGACRGQELAEIAGDQIVTILPEFDGEQKPPATYGGVSGGGLWAVFGTGPRGQSLERALVGVPFYEEEVDGRLTIRCHAYPDLVRVASAWNSLLDINKIATGETQF